jgi:hypothetical protein
MALQAILLLIAIILFAVDTFGAGARFNLQSAGLAFVAGALLIGVGGL